MNMLDQLSTHPWIIAIKMHKTDVYCDTKKIDSWSDSD